MMMLARGCQRLPEATRGYQRLLETALLESATQVPHFCQIVALVAHFLSATLLWHPTYKKKIVCIHPPYIHQMSYVNLFTLCCLENPQIQQFLSIGLIFERPIFWSLAANLGTPFKAPTKLDTLKGQDTIIGC